MLFLCLEFSTDTGNIILASAMDAGYAGRDAFALDFSVMPIIMLLIISEKNGKTILKNGRKTIKMYRIAEIYDLNHTLAKDYLSQFKFPWEALEGIKDLILALGPVLGDDYEEITEHVWVHKTAKVFPSAFLGASCIIGPETEVRHCAFIRGNALVGANCVVGNSVELKNVILFDHVQTPHYNYVGDSILGYYAHMGAGSITSNVRADKRLVVLHDGADQIETGIKKFGAMIGDYVEIGCNAVLNPGTVIGKNSVIYPTTCVRGIVPENCIVKNNGKIVQKR